MTTTPATTSAKPPASEPVKPELIALAELAGIQPRYTDVFGVVHEVPADTLIRLIEAVGFSAGSDAEIAQSSEKLHARENRVLPQVKLLNAQHAVRIAIPGIQEWTLMDEEEQSQTHAASQDEISLPALAMGYYDLTAKLRDGTEVKSRLIVTPPRCWLPEEIEKGKRVWGLAAQIYGLRSAHNFGMGDFTDLTELAQAAGKSGADLIGINPIHAMFPNNEYHFSPYSPSSRLFVNTLYIDPRAIDGFDSCEDAQRLFNEKGYQERLEKARTAELVDYPEIMRLKWPIIEALYRHFLAGGDRTKFDAFVNEQGRLLKDQALYDTLNEHFSQQKGEFVCWWDWPEEFRSARGPAPQKFAQENAARIDYFCWMQWVADVQLGRAQRLARESGMLLGLYRDLAVGSDQAGAEVWLEPDRFIRGVAVGAPPDRRNPKGQNWGLPPLNPVNLRQHGYRPFIQLVRANMRHGRALRIDHAFGLARLFLIPNGESPRNGAYLTFHFEEMLAVLRLESHRNKCIVIGEDLGTFPPNYIAGAAESGLLSYRLLYFARDEHGTFIPPHLYPAQSLATLSTHDLPTLKGWLGGADIAERTSLDLYPSPDMPGKDRDERERAKPLLKEALVREGLHEGEEEPSLAAVQRYLARSPAHIIMMQLEDLLGVERQANIPATTDQRPNWRMKLPVPLESFLAAPDSSEKGPLDAIAPALREERERPFDRKPRATYRIQFHKDFTFDDAARIVPYLAELGVSHLYASPYLQARPGSTHGYDITDHNAFNPELGGHEGYRRMTAALEQHGIGQILDFVPNHMGIGEENAWWMRTLEWGQQAPEANYFDIDWSPRYPGGPSKLVLPALGKHYGEVLGACELQLQFDPAEGAFTIHYFDHHFPICPKSYASIWPDAGPAESPGAGDELKAHLPKDDAELKGIQAAIAEINAHPDRIHALLEQQAYRLAFWRVASSDINYRRFFDINDLAGLRAEDVKLFPVMHKLVLNEVRSGRIDGLRIDHIDGLADPAAYCRKLRAAAGQGLYLTVEKILAGHEKLAEDWGIDGTSGYDALNILNDLFVNSGAERYFDRIYRRQAGDADSFADTVIEGKGLILDTSLRSELNVLATGLKRIAERDPYSRDHTIDGLRQALKDIIVYYPVYRSYATVRSFSDSDRHGLDWAVGRAKRRSTLPDRSAYDFIRGLLAMERDTPDDDVLAFVRRFQQLSGPVMAKGLEDTSFYRYLRLISLNEVGGDPGRFGMSATAFHHTQAERARRWPYSMIATATHDTKRGEDARARLNALSEIPRDWLRALIRWTRFNASRKTALDDGGTAPSAREEYFLYQTLLGSWPVEMLEQPTPKGIQAYLERLEAYVTKAFREAKLTTSWTNPDEGYEASVHAFLRAILDVSKPNPFLQDFLPFVQRLAQAGLANSLAQTTLKFTVPGVPDIYQGSEYWDLSLVDPDNRRPVDYPQREASLADKTPLPDLLAHWADARVKQRLAHLLLADRAASPKLYTEGSYQPVPLRGTGADNFLAFLRQFGEERRIVLVPIRGLAFAEAGNTLAETSMELPEGCWTNMLTGQMLEASDTSLATLLGTFPVAVLAAS